MAPTDTRPSPFLDAALALRTGYGILPCNGFKEPLTKHGFLDATTCVEALEWWSGTLTILRSRSPAHRAGWWSLISTILLPGSAGSPIRP